MCSSSICSDAVVSQVLDELGLTLTDELSSKYLCKVKVRSVRSGMAKARDHALGGLSRQESSGLLDGRCG